LFIFQHCICSCCKHSVRLFLNFYPFKSHFFYQTFYLFVLQHFTFIFPFYSPLKTKKSRRFRRNFGREVTLKYLIWFRRDNFIILFLFLSFYYFINLLLILLFLFYLIFLECSKEKSRRTLLPFLFIFLFFLSLLILLFKSRSIYQSSPRAFLSRIFSQPQPSGSLFIGCLIIEGLGHTAQEITL